jgi:hypothetical protein
VVPGFRCAAAASALLQGVLALFAQLPASAAALVVLVSVLFCPFTGFVALGCNSLFLND